MIKKTTPHSCNFNGEGRAIIKESKSFYFFAAGNKFKFNYALKESCTKLKWYY